MKNVYMHTRYAQGFFCAIFALVSSQSWAAENGNMTYPAGASQYFIADFPLQSGNYLQLISNYTQSEQLNDTHGDKTPGLDFDMKVKAQTARFITVWDKKILGADVFASELILPYVDVDMSLNTAYGQAKMADDGLGDVTFSPVVLQWNLGAKNNFQTVAGLSMVLPVGSYSEGANLNISNHRFALQPTFGLKYKKDNGFEIGASPRISFNWENQATNYKTGTELIIDYMAAYKVGQWKPGVAGYYYTQFQDDEQNGQTVANSKSRGFAIGPALQYQFKVGALLSASWQKDVMVKNKSENDNFWLSLAIKY